MKRLIYLSKEYNLVVGDKFELFYRGIIKLLNPYNYYIKVTCKKGLAYPRYYTFTPTLDDVGTYELKVEIFDDFHNLLDEGITHLNIVEAIKPTKKTTVLCIGDSLTFNGVWPYEGYRRISCNDSEPKGLGFSDSLNFIGTCKKNDIGYEGYGGWQWKSYCVKDSFDASFGIWVNCKHNFDQSDQHSEWDILGYNWVMETILPDKIKFKRNVGNYYCGNEIHGVIKHISGGTHNDTIIDYTYKYEKSNPFYFDEINDISFKMYCDKFGFTYPDLVYIALSWNGLWVPFNDDFSDKEQYITKILNTIHKEFPKCRIRLMGIPMTSINGGITYSYGCSGPYSDLYGNMITCFNYNLYLEQIAEREEFKDFTSYIDLRGQFDVEYNMPTWKIKVNNRSNILEDVGNNGMHPNMDGYLQIGDCFFRNLVKDLKEE